MDKADLYWDEIAWQSYFSAEECNRCGVDSCRELAERIVAGERGSADCRPLSNAKLQAVKIALNGHYPLPEIPKLAFPRPVTPELIELNHPGNGDPIVVTGNNQYTQEILLAVLGNVAEPLFVAFSDTRGDTLDMAVIFGSFTAESVRELFLGAKLETRAPNSPLIIPGRAAESASALCSLLETKVEVGPVCAAELPLYLERRSHAPAPLSYVK